MRVRIDANTCKLTCIVANFNITTEEPGGLETLLCRVGVPQSCVPIVTGKTYIVDVTRANIAVASQRL